MNSATSFRPVWSERMRRKDRKPEKVFFVALVNVSFMCVAEVTTPELLFWCELRTLRPTHSPERDQTETHITAVYLTLYPEENAVARVLLCSCNGFLPRRVHIQVSMILWSDVTVYMAQDFNVNLWDLLPVFRVDQWSNSTPLFNKTHDSRNHSCLEHKHCSSNWCLYLVLWHLVL